MKLFLVGGFLGSGKTTAIVKATQLLTLNKQKVAVITNDQGDQLVDSAYVRSFGFTLREVSGGCFCCHYQQLDQHLRALEESSQPEIIFAESVGSCTDLIATIVRPLNKLKPDLEVIVSIFADAFLLLDIMEGRSSFESESVRYIYKKQLEEADILILNKVDLLSPEQIENIHKILSSEYSGRIILHQNSLKDDDVLNWLSYMGLFTQPTERRSLMIDYGLYGEGESRLAWLDNQVEIQSAEHNAVFISRWFIRSVVDEIQSMRLTIGHLKFFVETPLHKQKLSITTTSTGADIHMAMPEDTKVRILINARVETNPDQLQQLVSHVLMKGQRLFNCSITHGEWAAFKPGFPKPLHRMAT